MLLVGRSKQSHVYDESRKTQRVRQMLTPSKRFFCECLADISKPDLREFCSSNFVSPVAV